MNSASLKIVVVVQARTGSTRFPGKIMLPLYRKPLIIRMLERVSRIKTNCTIVAAITDNPADDELEKLLTANGYLCYRGDESDLLKRHYIASLQFKPDAVVKIPSDCPLIDPQVIDKVLSYFISNYGRYDYVSNLHPATYPDGNDVEIMTFSALKSAFEEASSIMEREHTTPYLWENPQRFKIGNVKWESGKDFSMTHRFTIDYKEDYDFISAVYNELYPVNPQFSLEDILSLLERRPDIFELNKKYAGVNWYRNHLNELKTINENQTKII